MSVILDLVWCCFLGASKRHIRELWLVSGATVRYFWKGSGKIREWSARGWGGLREGLRRSLVSDQDIRRPIHQEIYPNIMLCGNQGADISTS